jgi:hypothetical protein
MECHLGSEHAGRKKPPPAIRRQVVEMKAEHPGPNEIACAVYVRIRRRADHEAVGRVLEEEPITVRFVRRFPPYHEIP